MTVNNGTLTNGAVVGLSNIYTSGDRSDGITALSIGGGGGSGGFSVAAGASGGYRSTRVLPARARPVRMRRR